MQQATKIFLLILIVYAGVFLLSINYYRASNNHANTSLFTADNEQGRDLHTAYDQLKTTYQDMESELISLRNQVKQLTQPKEESPLEKINSNPFEILGAYPDPTAYLGGRPNYNSTIYSLIPEKTYCEMVDLYNLRHPENIFQTKNFFTDYAFNSPVRKAIHNHGDIKMNYISSFMDKEASRTRKHVLDHTINTFHILKDAFYRNMEIGKSYLCATQMFNHIPGHTPMIRKDDVLEHIQVYSKKYEKQPQCFDKSEFFPATYRLFKKGECQEFFRLINSEAYNKSLTKEPIQFLIKVGHGAHKSKGVFLLDKDETKKLNEQYNFGQKCGNKTLNSNSLIAQKYIVNPLLLDMNNKFDMRVYFVIASTNPVIAYYHDGYLRVALNTFDKFSGERATHLTNTFVAQDLFKEAKEENKKIHGMNAEQLKDYHLWTFDKLERYLLYSRKITDKNWLNNYLRPSLQKAFIHLVRMTSKSLWKQSNVYELYGLDFMLDEDMNLYFIECNPGPLLDGVKPQLITKMLTDLFEITFAYYRSRMHRVIAVIKEMQEANKTNAITNYDTWKNKYQEASLNRLEKQYQISKSNTWQIIMDEYQPGARAYFGHISEECV